MVINRFSRVLIVEDEALVAFLLEDMLKDAGCRVAHVACRLHEGMAAASEAAFDVAFLDVNLGNGQFSFPIAEHLQRRGIPFAFVTGNGRPGLEGRFPDVTVLHKPFRTEDIGAYLDSL